MPDEARLGAEIDKAADAGRDYATMWDVMSAIDELYSPPPTEGSTAADALIEAHWGRFDGIVDEEEEKQVDLHHLPPGTGRPDVGHRPSAYGEVSRRGARELFKAMGLQREGVGACFIDLGSGVGRLVAQAWLELPPSSMDRAIGVELAPTRHAAAVRAWRRLVDSGASTQRGGAAGRRG